MTLTIMNEACNKKKLIEIYSVLSETNITVMALSIIGPVVQIFFVRFMLCYDTIYIQGHKYE